MNNLETTYLQLKLKNPLIAASSGLTGNIEKIKELANAGIGAIVLKSIFEEQINHEISNMLATDNTDYPEAQDYIKGYLRDNSVRNHIELIRSAKKETDVPIIASINCVSATEWIKVAGDFQAAGADALELNLFYLPVNRNEDPVELTRVYMNIMHQIKREVSIPVSVKAGIYHENIIRFADILKGAGADGIVMFNRFYEPDINLEKLEITASEVLSSPTDIRRSLRWVGMVSSSVNNLDVAASTGIHDGKAVLKMLLAGAKATQLCSTIYINGIKVIPEMLLEISDFMKKWNFKKVDDFRGRLSYKNIPDPMLYERSQFMKYFSGNN